MKSGKYLLLITLTMVLCSIIMSCEEDSEVEDNKVKESQDKDSNAISSGEYSGITEVDENMVFKSVDPDDWRDDGILSSCIVYPNPTLVSEWWLICRYKLISQAYVAMIIRDPHGNIYRQGSPQKVYPYTIWDNLPHGQKPGIYKADIILTCQYEDCFKLPEPGIYRLFIYASINDLILQMLRDTGTFNASREQYSMVYGDILITKN